jgi:Zn-dependent protease
MDVQYILIVLGVVLFSMTLHEAMHGFVSNWLGDDTARLQGRLTLNPVKHIDPYLTLLLPLILAAIGAPIFGGAKPVPFNPARLKYDEWGVALVAISGPLTNLVIAFILFGSYVVAGLPDSGIAQQLLITGVYVNLGFFVFNMLPVPPLDGSRVVYALAPEFVQRAMSAVEQYGLIFIFAIVLFASSLIGGFMLTAINAIMGVFMLIFGLS